VTDNEAAFEAIRQVHNAWLAAELRGDVEGILCLCTPDVRWLEPGRPLLGGREAGRQLLHAAGVKLLDIHATDLRIELSGELAYKTSRYETRYRAGGQERMARGTHLWILRREGVTWRVALVTWQAEV
jgi:ketosteroid isomerase-like protein